MRIATIAAIMTAGASLLWGCAKSVVIVPAGEPVLTLTPIQAPAGAIGHYDGLDAQGRRVWKAGTRPEQIPAGYLVMPYPAQTQP